MDQQTLPHIPPPTPPPSTAQLIESLLFVAGEPVAIGQLSRVLDLPADTVERALDELTAACLHRGIRLQRQHDHVQFVSAPETAPVIARFLGIEASTRLSPAALEVLAIVAYRQPLTRAQIEAVRGVDSSGVIRVLLARDLIGEAGRLDTVGRPILYTITPEFLRQFGLTSLEDLPPLETALPETDNVDEGSSPKGDNA